ncbi:MAG: DMT family transporter [Myxococcales bacterium]|nr:DMT family transporter [Myxococcales bacterium]USN50290.1 MAG: DMT family transporter [Myxococcales bacterium]
MIYLAILEYAILASTFTIAKVAVGYADPLFLIGVRMLCSSPLMFLVHKFSKANDFTIKKEHWKLFIGVSLFHIFLPFIGEFWALQYISSAKTAITYSLTPFIAAILSFFILKKKTSFMQTIGLLIGLFGLLPIFLSGDEVHLAAGEFLTISLPELVLLLSVISASYAWFLVSNLMNQGYGISFINGVAMLIGGVLSLITWYMISQGTSPIRGDFNQFLLWTSLLIVVANVISYNFYGWLLKHISITLMSAVGFLCPVFASLYGLFLLNEKLELSHLIALVMVAVGIWLFYRGERKAKS